MAYKPLRPARSSRETTLARLAGRKISFCAPTYSTQSLFLRSDHGCIGRRTSASTAIPLLYESFFHLFSLFYHSAIRSNPLPDSPAASPCSPFRNPQSEIRNGSKHRRGHRAPPAPVRQGPSPRSSFRVCTSTSTMNCGTRRALIEKRSDRILHLNILDGKEDEPPDHAALHPSGVLVLHMHRRRAWHGALRADGAKGWKIQSVIMAMEWC